MYLDLGGDVLISTKDIVAVIDKESIESSTNMEKFFHHPINTSFQKKQETIKSIIVTTEQIYYSPLAAGTLKKRAQRRSLSDFK